MKRVAVYAWKRCAGSTPWRRWPDAYGKGNSVYHRQAEGWDWDIWPRRMSYRQADPDLSRRVVGQHDRARLKKEAILLSGRSRDSCRTQIRVLADRQGRPLSLRVTGGPRPASKSRPRWTPGRTRRGPAGSHRVYDGDAWRAGRTQQSLEAVMLARARRTPARPGMVPGAPCRGTGTAGSHAGGAWPPAMTHTRIVAWVFGTWRR